MYDTPALLVLLVPEDASHNMKPPKLLLERMELPTYFSTVARSEYPEEAELEAPGKPTNNLIFRLGEVFSAKLSQVSQLNSEPRLQ